MRYLANAFSLQMLDLEKSTDVVFTPISLEEAKEELWTESINRNPHADFKSVIGHEDTSNLVNSLLAINVPSNREAIKITPKDKLIVAQLVGGRLPEGSTTLTEGVSIQFIKVELKCDWIKSFNGYEAYSTVGILEIKNETWSNAVRNYTIDQEYESFNLNYK